MALVQTAVRFFLQNEPRYWTVDNRPLTDLDSNVKSIVTEIGLIEATGVLGMKFYTGVGSPEGVITASVGSLYVRSDGAVNTTLYVKQVGAGATGWAAK